MKSILIVYVLFWGITKMIDEKKLITHIENQYREWGEEYDAIQILGDIEDFPKVNEWIPVEERLPEEHELIDDETGYYNKSDNVLCCGKNEYNEIEYWIDYTIDGEWQCSEYLTGDEMYWRPLPEPFKRQ